MSGSITKQVERTLYVFLALVLLLANSALVSAAAAKKQVLLPIAEITDTTLSSKKGFLLIYLEIDGIAPSLEISPIKGKGKRKSSRHGLTESVTLSLKNVKRGLYALPFAKGEYQITSVKAPYYDLPYVFSTNNSKRWRFRIEPQRTNYVGHVLFEKERTSRSIFVKLLNRLAADRKLIAEQAQHLTAEAPLSSGSWLRDDYLDFAFAQPAHNN